MATDLAIEDLKLLIKRVPDLISDGHLLPIQRKEDGILNLVTDQDSYLSKKDLISGMLHQLVHIEKVSPMIFATLIEDIPDTLETDEEDHVPEDTIKPPTPEPAKAPASQPVLMPKVQPVEEEEETVYKPTSIEEQMLFGDVGPFGDARRAEMWFEKSLVGLKLPKDLIALVPGDIALQYHIIPVKLDKSSLDVVTDNVSVLQDYDQLQRTLKRDFHVKMTSGENIKQALSTYYADASRSRTSTRVERIQKEQNSADSTAPLRRKVDDLLNFCIDMGASDLHVLPYSDGIYIQLRINGSVIDYTDKFSFLPSESTAVVSILKGFDTGNNADATNNLMPQHGSFERTRNKVIIECRMETVPVGGRVGEESRQKVNIRFLPQGQKLKTLDSIYTGEDLHTIKQVLYRGGSGLFLNAGPVGTGKSTALYAEIDYLWKLAQQEGHQLIVYTIENPIEIRDERFTQTQVRYASDERTNLTPEKLLASSLRSDPSIVLYGEIRDAGDADVAMKASQTGLKMFSTIHAGDCVRTINRLMDLNVSTMSLLAELRIIICQRLIGTLCPECSQEHHLTKEEREILSDEELKYLERPDVHLRERGNAQRRAACQNPNCKDGITGRVAVVEYVVFDNDIRDALLSHNDFHTIQQVLKKHNFHSMWDKGFRLACQGKMELSEIIQKIGK
ncbi:GspE/PulE family protein [uncultured Mitsuokella sp.]|uniref:GspE/PulE family protein n=1 Tax=uncultured Mitsuokella sp. TaxID=453120 RepID=UPI00266B98B6|nr:ATPase, T2SS/T4P/T4SS family [uncultured Mitsuokella sp.]